MASCPARRPVVLLLLALLVAALSSHSAVRAAMERSYAKAPASAPVVAAGLARQEFHVSPAPGSGPPATGMSRNGVARRPVKEWRRSARRGRGRGGGTGSWAFSAMLPRGFVPPSGSSACHNDMPATASDAQFFACGGAGIP